jgi:hypothetical protein
MRKHDFYARAFLNVLQYVCKEYEVHPGYNKVHLSGPGIFPTDAGARKTTFLPSGK